MPSSLLPSIFVYAITAHYYTILQFKPWSANVCVCVCMCVRNSATVKWPISRATVGFDRCHCRCPSSHFPHLSSLLLQLCQSFGSCGGTYTIPNDDYVHRRRATARHTHHSFILLPFNYYYHYLRSGIYTCPLPIPYVYCVWYSFYMGQTARQNVRLSRISQIQVESCAGIPDSKRLK